MVLKMEQLFKPVSHTTTIPSLAAIISQQQIATAFLLLPDFGANRRPESQTHDSESYNHHLSIHKSYTIPFVSTGHPAATDKFHYGVLVILSLPFPPQISLHSAAINSTPAGSLRLQAMRRYFIYVSGFHHVRRATAWLPHASGSFPLS
jgi:hypothetical protein